MSSSPGPARQSIVDKVLNSPIAALAPWIVMALLHGSGRFNPGVLWMPEEGLDPRPAQSEDVVGGLSFVGGHG